MAQVQANFEWHRLGTVTMIADKATFPSGPTVPGIWRVSISQQAHHGAAKDLRSAMYALTTPGPTQTTNQRVNDAAREGLVEARLVVVDVITSAQVNVHGQQVSLNLELDDSRAFVKAAAILAGENADPDPESVDYRRALAAAQKTVAALATTDMMRADTHGKPAEPHKADVKTMREALTTLTALVAAHDRYWPTRWGHEGNPSAR
jgi:hydroxylamine reductase (hybrid-cluster protein)